jgi:hypothetical protein
VPRQEDRPPAAGERGLERAFVLEPDASRISASEYFAVWRN